MSEQREATEVKGTNTEKSPEQIELERKIEKHKLKEGLRAVVLDRTSLTSALKVDVPDDVTYQWVRNEPIRIKEMRDKGYEVDKIYGKQLGLHDANADGSTTTGDLILMTAPKLVREVIDELRDEDYIRRHGKPGEINQLLKEEKDFLAEQQTLGSSHIGTAAESRATPVAAPPK